MSLGAVYLTNIFGAALHLTAVYIAALYLINIVYYTALSCYVHDFSVNFCSYLTSVHMTELYTAIKCNTNVVFVTAVSLTAV